MPTRPDVQQLRRAEADGDSSDEEYLHKFAQVATDPDYPERAARGPLVYQAVGDQSGRHYTRTELQAALGMESPDPATRSTSSSPERTSSARPQRTASEQPSIERAASGSAAQSAPDAAGTPVDKSSTLRKSLTHQTSGVTASSLPAAEAGASATPMRTGTVQELSRRGSVTFRPSALAGGGGSGEAAAQSGARATADPNIARTVELATDNDRSEVADWGRTGEHSPRTASSSGDEAQRSMSSGLSPRDKPWGAGGKGGPRARPFTPDAGLTSLVHTTKNFVESQKLRRNGQAPASMGLADDLATRLAYESLSSLSGMASKVQETIEHNRSAFANQVAMIDRQTMQKAMFAWKTHHHGKAAQRDKLRRAVNRILRGTLSRAFYVWKDHYKAKDQSKALRQKLRTTILRGLLGRCFGQWRRLTDDRWWKKQLLFRDREIELLERQCGGFRTRPIVVLRKRRLSMCLSAWFAQAQRLRRKRLRLARAVARFRHRQLTAAWEAWLDFANVFNCTPHVSARWAQLEVMGQHRKGSLRGLQNRRDKRAQASMVLRRMSHVKLGQAWRAWRARVAVCREKRAKAYRAGRLWLKLQTAKAFRTWVDVLAWRHEKRSIVQRWKRPVKAAAFRQWVEQMRWQQAMRARLRKAVMRMQRVKLAAAFTSWAQHTTDVHAHASASQIDTLQADVAALRAENERMRRDNERFVRIIDSGEWGRGRVAELVQAGQVLQQEREQLRKLMGHLRSDYEAVERAKVAQAEELAAVKERMKKKGAANNKMLVKGGSSFNALVRAMKQQVVDTNTGAKDPNLMFEIDNLSMNRVQVFPDGELDVQARCNAPHSAAFVRPTSAGRSLRPDGAAARTKGSGKIKAGPPGTAQDVAQALYSLSPGDVETLQHALQQDGGLPPARPPSSGLGPGSQRQLPPRPRT